MANLASRARLIVQSDWEKALREVEGRAWVTFRRGGISPSGQNSIHGELKCIGHGSGDVTRSVASDNFSIDQLSQRKLTVTYQDGPTRHICTFQAPGVQYTTIHSEVKSIVCMDATSGGLALSCDTDSKLKIWTTSNGEIRRDLKGHLGDVYTCRFFPSGVVALSGGADTQIKIWSAETGQCATTMTGHKAGVTDTAIVERGRNIVSVSRDGTAKLWDCGSKSCLTTFSDVSGGVVNTCALQTIDSSVDLGRPGQATSEKEVLTGGKMLLLGTENGHLQGYGLNSRQQIFNLRCSDAVNCCTYLGETMAVCGTQNGQVVLLDLRNSSEPFKVFQESRSAILSMAPYEQGFFVSTGDGSCYFMNEVMETSLELTGPDCDPVYKVAHAGSNVYTACRDGSIRRYSMHA